MTHSCIPKTEEIEMGGSCGQIKPISKESGFLNKTMKMQVTKVSILENTQWERFFNNLCPRFIILYYYHNIHK